MVGTILKLQFKKKFLSDYIESVLQDFKRFLTKKKLEKIDTSFSKKIIVSILLLMRCHQESMKLVMSIIHKIT